MNTLIVVYALEGESKLDARQILIYSFYKPLHQLFNKTHLFFYNKKTCDKSTACLNNAKHLTENGDKWWQIEDPKKESSQASIYSLARLIFPAPFRYSLQQNSFRTYHHHHHEKIIHLKVVVLAHIPETNISRAATYRGFL